jgi:acyl-CoA synthetase (NDP forming)
MTRTHAPVDEGAARAFLASGRLAVVGASDEHDNFGRTVYRELRDHGTDVVAVHPRATTVEGDPCYARVGDVPGTVDGAIVMVPADAAPYVLRDCAAAGVHRVWLFRGIGSPGATTPETLRLADELELDVVPGACPLMFLEPTAWVHRFHRSIRRARRGLVATAA